MSMEVWKDCSREVEIQRSTLTHRTASGQRAQEMSSGPVKYHSRKPRLKQSNTKVFVGLIPYHSTDKLYRRGASDVARFVLLGLGKYFALSRNEEYHSLRAGYRCHQHLVLCLPYSRQRLVALPFSYPERRCWLNRRGAERCHQAPERRSDQYNTFSDPQMSFVSASRERCTNQ
ncbi:hypothetical protein BDR05DRAFT_180101 [Suillus weaverae]|nr:hypothetical protein BDR05DRAFT_180101 [Suillus weaverae]